MANRLGDDYKIYVESTTAGAFNVLEGQSSLSISSPQDLIDQTAKGDTYKLRQPGRPDRTISAGGGLRLPDTTGVGRAYDLYVARTAARYQIRRTPFSGSDIVFDASMWTSNLERDLGDQQNATWSLQLTLNTAPTVDLVG